MGCRSRSARRDLRPAGPNGAGKTTTLRVLAGLLAPSAGRAVVAGIDVTVEPLKVRRQLGFLANTTGLYARLTGRELLDYFGRLHRIPIKRPQPASRH